MIHFAFQLTSVNHFLDLSITYGNNDKDAEKLRQFQGGRLLSEMRRGKEWPPRAVNASGTCRLQKEQDACYMAGKTITVYSKLLLFLQYPLSRRQPCQSKPSIDSSTSGVP